MRQARVRVTIVGSYLVDLDDEDAYPGCATAEQCAALDQKGYDDHELAEIDVIGWCDDETFSVTIEPAP
jgi:hypothetical protein